MKQKKVLRKLNIFLNILLNIYLYLFINIEYIYIYPPQSYLTYEGINVRLINYTLFLKYFLFFYITYNISPFYCFQQTFTL